MSADVERREVLSEARLGSIEWGTNRSSGTGDAPMVSGVSGAGGGPGHTGTDALSLTEGDSLPQAGLHGSDAAR
jgi:hypothetical protein